MIDINNIKNIGIIAGNGNLPLLIIDECLSKNITPYVACLKNFTKKEDYKNYKNIEINFGDIGKTISFFKKNNIKHIMFVGGVKKPNISIRTIFPDLKGFFLLMKLLKCKLFGDDNILKTIISFMEKEGFEILEIDKFSNNLKIKEGIATTANIPNKDYLIDIELGIKVLKQIGDLDIGQSIVIQNGIVLGIECIEGTQKLIERCSELKYKNGRKPILVKIKKTKQTRKIDLPSIGKDTIIQLKNAGFCGIAFDCNNGIVINKQETIETANKYNIFIDGIKI